MGRESIQYSMLKVALADITNDNTTRAYKHDIREFAEWARSRGYRKLDDILGGDPRRVVQVYRDDVLVSKTKSPQTEHRKIAAICKGLGIQRPRGKNDEGWDEGRIITSKRSSGSITRGRDAAANAQGKREAEQEKNRRLVGFQSAVGIRRSELGRLRGRDLVRDESGYLCVRVERGKGGKEQLQRVLPADEETVIQTFAGIAPDQKVFKSGEMRNHINLHGLRASHAQEAYRYYLKKADTLSGRRQLAEELYTRYSRFHPDGKGCDRFSRELEKCINDPAYVIRGDNRSKAKRLGLPIVYDRLALMCVSLFALSHFRLDVTVTNYMIQ